MTEQSLPTTGSARRKIAGERRRAVPARHTTAVTPTASGRSPEPELEKAIEAPAGGRARRWVATWLLAGLGVLVAAALVFDVVSLTRSSAEAAREQTQAESVASAFNTAPAEAEKAAEQVLGYDYTTLQQDSDEAAAFMTPAYAETFQKTVADILTQPATQARGKVEAKVMSSGVISASPNEVKVLLFVDQVSTTKADPRPQTALNRVIFTMVKTGERWLVSDVSAL